MRARGRRRCKDGRKQITNNNRDFGETKEGEIKKNAHSGMKRPGTNE